ncbi:hypothetical protein [Streptomyces violaceusniger]|uniref:HTH araC/xylS-type domain-containing protein n=1 Tax=Streptomyces violaceusniger TaxID=68280 RepID=A0A4D4LPA8_STRVO|nr:hypothetical protein SVIO_103320 [Streptomyces violaceusniger]
MGLSIKAPRGLTAAAISHEGGAGSGAAHEELAKADPHSGTNVAQIAYQWGFGHLGRFAGDYQRRYSQLPSTTLRT